jgi:hypothetical protein
MDGQIGENNSNGVEMNILKLKIWKQGIWLAADIPW